MLAYGGDLFPEEGVLVSGLEQIQSCACREVVRNVFAKANPGGGALQDMSNLFVARRGVKEKGAGTNERD